MSLPRRFVAFQWHMMAYAIKNNILNPANAEEHQAAVAARELVVDSSGQYVSDNTAIFVHLTGIRVSRFPPALGSRPPPAFSNLIVFTLHT